MRISIINLKNLLKNVFCYVCLVEMLALDKLYLHNRVNVSSSLFCPT